MATTPAPVALTTTQRNAFATVKGYLDQYGLGSLSGFVYNEIVLGKSPDEVARDLRTTPQFAQRFPAIAAREKAGLPAISPAEYVSYEQQATELMKAAGLPKGFYDSPSDFTNLLANDVSPSELNDRIGAAKQATYNLHPEDARRLASEFGMHPGSGPLTAYFLDPKRALPILQNMLEGAKVGGAADRTGYAGLSNDRAMKLAQGGISADQAQQGFTALTHEQQLFGALPGESDPGINQGVQLGAAFDGNAADQDMIEAQRRKRQAAFQDGGGFAQQSQKTTGLGTADRS